MSGNYSFQEFSDGQRRIYDVAVQTYEAFLEALRQARPFRGGRHWKRIKGRDYLYQYFDRYGHGRSLGPRSPHTEKLLTEFRQAKAASARRVQDLRRQLTEQARFCRAAWLHRLPRLAAKILGLLGQDDPLKENFTVIDSHAIPAYEFAAGVFHARSKPLDFLGGSGLHLTLAAATDFSQADFLALLRRADRSFAALEAPEWRAVNHRGYLVQVLRPGQQPPRPLAGPGEAPAAETGNLHYLLASPRFSQVVIGQDGSPVLIMVPDPRAFALHKLWLSQQPDREEAQRSRDRAQAGAVAELILRYLPQYHFFHADLRRFPPEVVRQAEDLAEGFDLAADLEVEY